MDNHTDDILRGIGPHESCDYQSEYDSVLAGLPEPGP
jgi:hypothetical protein